MKKSVKALPIILAASLLAACGSTEDISSSTSSSSSSVSSESSSESVSIPTYEEGIELAKKAVASLAHNSHKVHVDFESWIERGSPDELGIYSGRVYDLAYSYFADGGIGYSESSVLTHCDIRLNEETKEQELLEDTRYSLTNPTANYFRGDDGTITRESLNERNTVDIVTMADFDDTTGVYTPYAWEDMYKNPWDYIRPSDITLDEEGNLVLANDKANFLVDCYYGTATNWVGKCIVNMNEAGDAVASLSFEIPNQSTDRYVRRCTAEVTYSAIGVESVKHLAPLTNSNPELAAALEKTKTMDNFTYKKAFVESPFLEAYGNEPYHYTCYYTPQAAFYDYNDEDLSAANDTVAVSVDTHYYANLESDGLYHVYCFGLSGGEWSWSPVALSSSTLYTIPSFADLAPRWYQVSPALFTKTGEREYTADPSVTPILGTYFDNQMAGCYSEALTTNTTEVVITLDEAGNISTVETGFTVQGLEQKLVFTISDIGTTSIPASADFPNA